MTNVSVMADADDGRMTHKNFHDVRISCAWKCE